MNITINLVISANAELLTAIQALTNGKVTAPVPSMVVALPESAETKKTRKAKVEPLIPIEDFGHNKHPEPEPVVEETKTDLTLEMLIADAVPKSRAGHKDKIKAKVTQLGYESITDLQPEHFNDMFAFLQTIPKP